MFFWHVPAPNEALLDLGLAAQGAGHPVPDRDRARLLRAADQAEGALPLARRCRRPRSPRSASPPRASGCTSGRSPPSRSATTPPRSPTPPGASSPSRTGWRSWSGGIFAGHLRSIIGSLTVEEIIRERDRLAQEVKDGSHGEMEKLGIVVDSLQIQEIEDSTGYINNIAAPHAAAVASQARIAAAKADQEATQREQEAAALKAAVRPRHRDQAGRLRGRDRAGQGQGGPGRPARRGPGVAGGHRAADRCWPSATPQLTEKRLESEVRRPADAEAYKTRTLADADRDKVKAETEAEAFRQRTLAEANRDTVKFNTEAEANRQRKIADAEAEAEKVKAAADAAAKKHEADGDAYAQRTVADGRGRGDQRAGRRAGRRQPGAHRRQQAHRRAAQLVAAAAKGISGSNLTVLNGTDGVNQVVAGVVGQGLAIYEALRKSVATTKAADRRLAGPRRPPTARTTPAEDGRSQQLHLTAPGAASTRCLPQ